MNTFRKALLFLIAMATSLAAKAAQPANDALAQANSYLPDPNSPTVQALGKIFGDVGGLLGGAQSTAMGSLFQIFNSGVLVAGSVIVAYTILTGILKTAHDGEVLGRQWSSIWIPIRTSVGFAMALPGASGYAMVQVVVIWCALLGAGIADKGWAAVVNAMPGGGTAVRQFSTGEAMRMANSIFEANYCGAMISKANNTNADGSVNQGGEAWRTAMVRRPTTAANHGIQYDFKVVKTVDDTNISGTENIGNVDMTSGGTAQQVTTYSAGTCGAVVVASDEGVLNEKEPFEVQSADSNELPGQMIMDVETALSDINSARVLMLDAALHNMDDMIRPIAESVANGAATKEQAQATISAAAAAYAARVNQDNIRIRDVLNPRLQQMIDQNVIDKGWLFAGAWYQFIARMHDLSLGAQSAVISFTTPEYSKTMDPETEMLAKAAQSYSKTVTNSQGGKYSSDASQEISSDADDNDILDFMGGITSKSSSAIADVLDLGRSDTNPLLTIKILGDRILSVAISFVGVSALGALGGGWLGTIGGGTGGWGAAMFIVGGAFIIPLAISMLAAGVMLSTYLPFIPYLTWMLAVMGWLVLVVESMAAAPVWAIMHAMPDGDDWSGKGASGYMIVFGLVLRPILMIIGLCASIFVLYVGAWLVIQSFDYAAGNVMSVRSGFLGIPFFIGKVVAILIVASLLVRIAHRTFGMINELPTGIMRWIGGGHDSLGDDHNEGEQRNMVVGAISHVRTAGQSAGAAVQKRGADRAGQNDNQNLAAHPSVGVKGEARDTSSLLGNKDSAKD